MRREWAKTCDLVAGDGLREHPPAAKLAREVLDLKLAGLPWILRDTDDHPLPVGFCCSLDSPFDLSGSAAESNHVLDIRAPVSTERHQDANRPIRIVLVGLLFGASQIPRTNPDLHSLPGKRLVDEAVFYG